MREKKTEIPSYHAAGGKQIRLRTVANVRAYLASVMRGLKDGSITGKDEIDRARVMIYAAKVMSELITGSAIEERMAALEERAQTQDDATVQ